MLQSKQNAYDYVQAQAKRLVAYHKKLNELYGKVHDKYKVPKGQVADLLGGNVSAENVNDLVLYGTIDYLVEFGGKEGVDKFYTPIEINQYSKMEYKEETIDFPIRIKCVPVTDDQWIGATNSSFLMQLRRNQMINYNINAQRTMTRKKDGDNVFWKISVNKSAVKKITDAYLNEDYIPDTITLGIVEDANPDFYYDQEISELVINKIKYFDIPDGYHRYLAMGNISDSDPKFEYPMELRIVNFTEDKTKQFIYQQDQKTKMRKVDSNSMNMNSAANIILERLNRDNRFNFRKGISRNEGVINFPIYATIVEYYYLKGIRSTASTQTINKKVVEVENELVEGFEQITNIYPELIDKKELNMQELMLITYMIKEKKYDGLSKTEIKKIFKKLEKKEITELFKYKTTASISLHRAIEGLF